MELYFNTYCTYKSLQYIAYCVLHHDISLIVFKPRLNYIQSRVHLIFDILSKVILKGNLYVGL